MSDELLTIPEAAVEKGIHLKTLYRLVRDKKIPSVNQYGRVLVRRADLLAYEVVRTRPRKLDG